MHELGAQLHDRLAALFGKNPAPQSLLRLKQDDFVAFLRQSARRHEAAYPAADHHNLFTHALNFIIFLLYATQSISHLICRRCFVFWPRVVNIICMKWGTKFGPEYVNRLHSMVSRHLAREHRFICFTDDSSGLDAGIQTLPLPT